MQIGYKMFIVRRKTDNFFLTNRKNTNVLYKYRSMWSENLDDAKIFSTKSAAVNSANHNGEEYYIKKVKIIIEE